MSEQQLMLRDVRHVKITSARIRAMLHEAWKNGNESENLHHQPDGQKERHDYVSKVMGEQNLQTWVPRPSREAGEVYRNIAKIPAGHSIHEPHIELKV